MKKFSKKRTKYQATSNPVLEKEREELAVSIAILGNKAPSFVLERYAELNKQLSAPNKVNATKLIYNGVEFDSKREANFAQRLDNEGLPYQHSVEVEIMEGFKLEAQAIRPINIVVDFLVCGDWFVDIKGIILQPFPIKWKLLKNKFRDSKKYVVISKTEEIESFIILAKRTGWKNT